MAGKSTFLVTMTWDDAPHLSQAERDDLSMGIPEYMRDARTKGIPQLGAGHIYPIPEQDIVVDRFDLPDYWPRGYGLDVGWNNTAAVWIAYDRTDGVRYLYSVYKRGQAEPVVHAAAIKQRGEWVPGKVDPAARASSQADGKKLLNLYRQEGLHLSTARSAVEAGILKVYNALSTGQLKVFRHLTPWLEEFRMYRREMTSDGRSKIVKQHDHLLDATRYAILAGIDWLETPPASSTTEDRRRGANTDTAWMGT